jgi:hypothetical protein|tara:strand:+ start:53 stop:253 length:201 start_codon:yes stop_codon:yes gene_type:complete
LNAFKSDLLEKIVSMFIESSIEKIIEFIKDKVVHDLLPIRPGRNVQIIKTKLIETLYLVFVMKAIK